MKKTFIVILLFSLAIITGCSNADRKSTEVNENILTKLRLNMDTEKVYDIVGVPYYDKDVEELQEEFSDAKKLTAFFTEVFDKEEDLESDYHTDDMKKDIEKGEDVEILRYFVKGNDEKELFLYFKDDQLKEFKIIE